MNRFELIAAALCLVCLAITIGCMVYANELKQQRDLYRDLLEESETILELTSKELDRTRLKMRIYRDSFLATMGIHSDTKPANTPHTFHK